MEVLKSLREEIEENEIEVVKYVFPIKMGDDDKKLELIRKNLGLGRWAIGGTKLIYSYDADQYDKEREGRLGQYASGEGLPEAPVGRQADKFGIFSFKDEYTENEGGYDFVFYDVDDAQ
jgi:hypothetical protein